MKIHPTAIISPKSEISEGVEIGPYAVIEDGVVIGSGTVIQARAIISGSAKIGRENLIGYGAIIGGDPQDHSFLPETNSRVVIGDHNRIREYCTIHRGTADGSATTVGNHNYFMAGTHLAHDAKVGSHVTLGNNVLLAGHVEIQDRVYVGGGSVFHQHIRVGQICLIQGNSGFGKDVPPFTIGAGHNDIVGPNFSGLRKAGLSVEQRGEVRRAFSLLYRSGFNTKQALEQAELTSWNTEGRLFFDFVTAATKRGLCDIRKPRNAIKSAIDNGDAASERDNSLA